MRRAGPPPAAPPLRALALAAAILAAGCAKETPARDFGALPLVVYSSQPEELVRFVVDEYRDRTGARVTLVRAGTGELLDRLRAESAAPRADLLWGGGADSLADNPELFEPWSPREAEAIPGRWRDPGRRWTGFSVTPVVIAWNARLVDAARAPRSWAALLDGGWDGSIAFADPRSSASALTELATLDAALPAGGRYGEGGAARLARSLGGRLLGSSGQAVSAIVSGESLAGPCLEPAALAAGGDLAWAYPAEGTSAVPDAVALVRGAPNAGAARAFIEFLLGRDVATAVAARFGRRSTRSDAPLPPGLPPLESIRLGGYGLGGSAAGRAKALADFLAVSVPAPPVPSLPAAR